MKTIKKAAADLRFMFLGAALFVGADALAHMNLQAGAFALTYLGIAGIFNFITKKGY